MVLFLGDSWEVSLLRISGSIGTMDESDGIPARPRFRFLALNSGEYSASFSCSFSKYVSVSKKGSSSSAPGTNLFEWIFSDFFEKGK